MAGRESGETGRARGAWPLRRVASLFRTIGGTSPTGPVSKCCGANRGCRRITGQRILTERETDETDGNLRRVFGNLRGGGIAVAGGSCRQMGLQQLRPGKSQERGDSRADRRKPCGNSMQRQRNFNGDHRRYARRLNYRCGRGSGARSRRRRLRAQHSIWFAFEDASTGGNRA